MGYTELQKILFNNATHPSTRLTLIDLFRGRTPEERKAIKEQAEKFLKEEADHDD